MRYNLVELLRTPVTGQTLHLDVFRKLSRPVPKGWAHCTHFCSRKNQPFSGDEACQSCSQEEIVDARLISEEGLETYPVIRGIPRLLPQEYMVQVWNRYPKWLNNYGTAYHSVESGFSKSKIKTQRRTAERFGREWQTFDRLLNDFKGIFQEYFDLVNLTKLNGKTVLDAGCGMGRWAFHMAPSAGRVIAFDLSFAVEPAYRNCYELGNVEVVQADIFSPPLQLAAFDLIYSLGVMHVLPDPSKAISTLKSLLAKNGELLIYTSYDLEDRPQYFRVLKKSVDLLRQITARAPAFCSYPIAFAVAGSIYLPFVYLGTLLGSLGLEDVERRVPLYQTYRGKSFRLILNDAVDRLTAPLENRYSKQEIEGWFSAAGFGCIRFADSGPYWKAIGQACNP